MIAFLRQLGDRKNRKALYCKSNFWDRKARNLQGSAVSQWPNLSLNNLLHSEHTALLDEWVGDGKGGRALDLGCGTGRLSRYLATKNWKALGMDFSEEALQLAKSQSRHEIIFQQGSVLDFCLQEKFDLVLCSGVLTVACRNEEDLRNAFAKVRDHLLIGGRFLLIEPVHSGFLSRVLDLGSERFTEVLQAAGFQIAETRQLHFWPFRLFLSHWNLPHFLTVPLYRAGEVLHRFLFASSMGDYLAISATRADSNPFPVDFPPPSDS